MKSKIMQEFIRSDYSVTATDSLNAPTELAASSTTSSSTVLDWTFKRQCKDVVGYNVYNGDELEYATTGTETTTVTYF
jgi:hypothetical protein